jgi:hypothetical protein
MGIDSGALILVQGAIEIPKKHSVEIGTRHVVALLSVGAFRGFCCDKDVNEIYVRKTISIFRSQTGASLHRTDARETGKEDSK